LEGGGGTNRTTRACGGRDQKTTASAYRPRGISISVKIKVVMKILAAFWVVFFWFPLATAAQRNSSPHRDLPEGAKAEIMKQRAGLTNLLMRLIVPTVQVVGMRKNLLHLLKANPTLRI
jgi:hypothetical protein